MKTRTNIILTLAGLLILITSFGSIFARSSAPAAGADVWNKIGVVSVRKVFTNCKRNEKFRAESKIEQEKAIAELQQLRAEIKAAEAGLETLKPGTKDTLTLPKSSRNKGHFCR